MKRMVSWMPVAIVTFFIGALLTPVMSGLSDCVVHFEPPRKIAFDNFACEPSNNFPGRSIRLTNLSVSSSGYFPRGTYAYGWRDREAFMNEWYGKHLKVMREPSMLDQLRPEEVYRFLWLRSFDNPIAVRVERSDRGINLFMKELSGSGGYDPGEIILNRFIALDQREWCGFMEKLEQADYWNLPLEEHDDGNDGAQWILEGVREGRYHAVDRWSPRDGEFREACIYLLELAQVDTGKLGDDLY